MGKLSDNYIDLKIEGLDELNKIISEFPAAVQNRIVINAMKASANDIIKTAKSNFQSVKKNKSQTGYADINSSFKVEKMKSKVGVKAGIKGSKGYLLRFINYGTAERMYKQKKSGVEHRTGKIQPTKFFESAVDSKRDQAMKNVEDNIITQLEKTFKKYAK